MSAGADRSPLPRERVTAPRRGRTSVPSLGDLPDPAGEVPTIYLRALIRVQLRLAVACAAGFVLTLAVAAVLIAVIPVLGENSVFGVPWAWALQAYGMYPLIAAFAVLYVTATTRNEKRWRSLVEDG